MAKKKVKLGFSGPLIAEKLTDRRWKVSEEFSYTSRMLLGDVYTVPRAFVTDLASVPRIFWRFFPPDGTYTQAAVLHDYLCEKKLLSYKETHAIFDEAMGVLGVGKFERSMMAWAVKHFGPRWK